MSEKEFDFEGDNQQKVAKSKEVKKLKERERRGKMIETVAELRRLVPQCQPDNKINQAVVMAYTVEYIASLQKKLLALEEERAHLLKVRQTAYIDLDVRVDQNQVNYKEPIIMMENDSLVQPIHNKYLSTPTSLQLHQGNIMYETSEFQQNSPFHPKASGGWDISPQLYCEEGSIVNNAKQGTTSQQHRYHYDSVQLQPSSQTQPQTQQQTLKPNTPQHQKQVTYSHISNPQNTLITVNSIPNNIIRKTPTNNNYNSSISGGTQPAANSSGRTTTMPPYRSAPYLPPYNAPSSVKNSTAIHSPAKNPDDGNLML